jgi:anaerobic selenocysteine-containing dehydrogenase
MHLLVRGGLADRDYLAHHTIGFERLEREVLPRFAPDRVSAITGIEAPAIERLAQLYGRAQAAFIRLGEGMTRLSQGGQALRAVALLPGLTGAYARRGGGALLYTGDFFAVDSSIVSAPASGPAQARTINHLRLGQALLEQQDPPIRSLLVAANNPAVTCPDAGKVRQGLAREDLFTIVHDPFMSVTARYADLVLPAALYLETEDLYRAYGAYFAQYAPRTAPPPAEAWSNFQLAQALGQRMQLPDPVFRQSAHEVLQAMFRGARGAAARYDADSVRTAGPIRVATDQAQRFLTPSGKLEFYSQSLADDGKPPMPDWVEDPEDTREAARWPLRLLTAPGFFQPHTVYSGVSVLRTWEGQPECVLHPIDAGQRQLRDGQRVRLFNARGAVGFILRVSDEVQPGVALVAGQRRDDETVSGTINLLCSDRYTDIGDGATYQSTWLDVAAWT